MATLAERLLEHGIRPRSYAIGNHKLLCPKCSLSRKNKSDPCLSLTIEDDGCRAVGSGMAAEGGGLGLMGIRERVMALGGTLDVMDLADKGFKLHAMIPFEAPLKPVQ